MGFQKSNDTSGMEKNTSTRASSAQKTSNVERLSNDTTKCQYERLSKSEQGKGE